MPTLTDQNLKDLSERINDAIEDYSFESLKQEPRRREITQEYLKSILHYDPKTGIFTWLIKGKMHNKTANYHDNYGYLVIMIDGKNFKGHRLAWLYMTGKWPDKDIDHKNGNPSINEWENLREATESQNLGNQKIRSNNKSGIKGVSWDKFTSMWRVNIKCGGKVKNLGRYTTLEEAALVYEREANLRFGEFARLR